MASQKIEREARAAITGMTAIQRLAYARRLVAAGWTERRIAKALGVCPATAHHLVHEIRTGQKRVTVYLKMCESCWDDFPANQLDKDGLCRECAAGSATSEPPEQW